MLDASAALAVLVPSQSSEAAREFFSGTFGALVAPPLFRLEVRNALLKLERRGVLPRGVRDAELAVLEGSIQFVAPATSADLLRVQTLARGSGIAIYDAVYLDLALVMQVHIVSRDAALLRAASTAGVSVADLR